MPPTSLPRVAALMVYRQFGALGGATTSAPDSPALHLLQSGLRPAAWHRSGSRRAFSSDPFGSSNTQAVQGLLDVSAPAMGLLHSHISIAPCALPAVARCIGAHAAWAT